MPQLDFPQSVADWLARGERGTSSETIVAFLWGLPITGRWGMSHPYDPDDLRRCLLLLQASPETAARFNEMDAVSPEWKRLVANWSRLEAVFREEVPDIHNCFRQSAPKTYDAMKRVLTSGTEPT